MMLMNEWSHSTHDLDGKLGTAVVVELVFVEDDVVIEQDLLLDLELFVVDALLCRDPPKFLRSGFRVLLGSVAPDALLLGAGDGYQAALVPRGREGPIVRLHDLVGKLVVFPESGINWREISNENKAMEAGLQDPVVTGSAVRRSDVVLAWLPATRTSWTPARRSRWR